MSVVIRRSQPAPVPSPTFRIAQSSPMPTRVQESTGRSGSWRRIQSIRANSPVTSGPPIADLLFHFGRGRTTLSFPSIASLRFRGHLSLLIAPDAGEQRLELAGSDASIGQVGRGTLDSRGVLDDLLRVSRLHRTRGHFFEPTNLVLVIGLLVIDDGLRGGLSDVVRDLLLKRIQLLRGNLAPVAGERQRPLMGGQHKEERVEIRLLAPARA